MRTLRIYSLTNFSIYHTAVLTIVVMLYIPSLVLIYLTTRSVHSLITFLQFLLLTPPASGNHKSDLFFYEFFFNSLYIISEIIQYLSFSI